MTSIRFIYFSLFFLFFSLISANAQIKLSNPLEPKDNNETNHYIGGVIGLGQNFQSGVFFVDCEDCNFEDGVGLNFMIGAFYEREATPWLLYGLRASYETKNLESSFLETEPLPYKHPVTQLEEFVNVQFRHTANVNMQVFDLMPYIKFRFFEILNFRTGLSVNFLASSKLKHTQNSTKKIATFNDNTRGIIALSDTLVQNSELRAASKTILGINPALGIDIPLSERVRLSPFLEYNFPFSVASTNGDSFKLNSWRFQIEVSVRLNSKEEEYNMPKK